MDNIVIDKTKCYVCGECVETCILDNLRLKLAPCRAACPIHTNCQGYIHLLAQGKVDDALVEVRKGLPFPGIIGRVCSHPCESHCKRTDLDSEPVAIRDIKRFLADHERELWPDLPKPHRRPQRVAVVGSGPAGMMASFDLAQMGYGVTVFEALDKAGGMLRVGIPEFRLPSAILDRELELLTRLGVEFKYRVPVGKNVSLNRLVQEYDAVFLATGAHIAPRLNLQGEDSVQVHSALDFLKGARSGRVQLSGRVVVIGGGNSAVDAAQTARRAGGKDVAIVCLESRDEMPAFPWEVRDALEEGVEIVNGWGPLAFEHRNGAVEAVTFARCLSVFDEHGRFRPRMDPSITRRDAADEVIVAIGQSADVGYARGMKGLTRKGLLAADPVTLQTSIPHVFAGGDALRGPKTVIDAMADGKEAAISIDRYLSGEGLHWGRNYLDGPFITNFEVDTTGAVRRHRTRMPKISPDDRRDFREVELGFSRARAIREAERCLKCGDPYGPNQTCWYCLPCEIVCPVEALRVEIPFLVR